MNKGIRALLSGFLAFIVATGAVRLFDSDRTNTDAMTIGGLTGGAVALSVWITTDQSPRQSESTD